jgi:uncharacterized phage protein (TIGR01671 family)
MRPIKFRGFSPQHNTWIVGFYHEVEAENIKQAYIFWQGESFPVGINSVGQFTGLTDKNGREIYEGDILECKSEFIFEGKQACTYSYHQIVFNDNFAVFNTLMVAQKDMKGKIYKPDNKEPNHYSFIDVCKNMQIVGCIYENTIF